MLGSAKSEHLRFTGMKLFAKYSNLCDHDTLMSRTDDLLQEYRALHSISR